MNKEKANPTPAAPGRYARPDEERKDTGEERKRIVVSRLAAACEVARKELPVVGCAVVALAIITALMYVGFISEAFMLILAMATIIKTAFNAGVIWHQLNCKKER